MRLHLLAIVVSMPLVFISCGVFKTKDSGKALKKTDSALVGTWATDCVDKADLIDDLGGNYTKEELDFSSLGDFDRSTIVHTDEGCQTEAIHMVLSGTYTEEGDVEGKPGVKKINMTTDKVTVTPDTDDAANLLNEKTLCGVTDWAKGKAVNVTGKDCPGFDYDQGDVIFDVYKVDDKNLYFGNSFLMLNKRSADTRPEEIDAETIYHKK